MVYNHGEEQSLAVGTNYNIPALMGDENVGSDFSDVYFYAAKDINIGDEIFSYYGGKKWFVEKGITFQHHDEKSFVDNSEVHTFPGCASSLTTVFKGRVYATQVIYAGDIVEISRTLILPASLAANENKNLDGFVWRRNSTGESDQDTGDDGESSKREMLLLHLGNGALYGTPSHDKSANLEYEWWYDAGQSEGVECSDQTMFMKFTATQDIQPSEELTVDLFSTNNQRLAAESLFSYCHFD